MNKGILKWQDIRTAILHKTVNMIFICDTAEGCMYKAWGKATTHYPAEYVTISDGTHRSPTNA